IHTRMMLQQRCVSLGLLVPWARDRSVRGSASHSASAALVSTCASRRRDTGKYSLPMSRFPWARELDTGFLLATSAKGVCAGPSCANKNMEWDDDSKIKSSRLIARQPSVVIHLNTLFTNF